MKICSACKHNSNRKIILDSLEAVKLYSYYAHDIAENPGKKRLCFECYKKQKNTALIAVMSLNGMKSNMELGFTSMEKADAECGLKRLGERKND